MKIQVLAPEVVGQIAAGEVLDRPANLVKELVENSLDAGASEVEVEFNQAGRDVCVRDNGCGIAREDLGLALLPHATSKITRSDDLYHLHSFGFRGEALASVAAVSHISLTSRAKGEEQGYRLQSEHGIMSPVAPISCRTGCEVRVRELFANVPARLKFLKSEAAEHGQIKNTLKAMALAHPEVGWSVRSKDVLVYHWPKAESWLERARAVLENDALYWGEARLEGVHAEVLVGSPLDAAQVNRNMWFFAQGRWIQDRSLTAAVMESYRNLLMHGEYPCAVVRLTMEPEDIDVNVHPTKSQVKFRDSQTVFRAVSRAIRSVLETAPWLQKEVPASVSASSSKPPVELEPVHVQTSLLSADPGLTRTQYNTKSFPLQEVRDVMTEFRAATPQFTTQSSVQTAPQDSPQAGFRWADMHVVGQIHQTYIVAQSAHEMYLVDQHAAHERVVFERLMHTFQQGKMEVQNLLLPLVLDLPVSELEALLKMQPYLERLGVSLEQMGPESVAIQAIPTLAKDSAVLAAIRKLADDLGSDTGEAAFERMIGDIFASMACHSVVRAGQAMSIAEMQSLLGQMDQYPLSSFCPHGRPVFVKRKFSDIEREFGRIV